MVGFVVEPLECRHWAFVGIDTGDAAMTHVVIELLLWRRWWQVQLKHFVLGWDLFASFVAFGALVWQVGAAADADGLLMLPACAAADFVQPELVTA